MLYQWVVYQNFMKAIAVIQSKSDLPTHLGIAGDHLPCAHVTWLLPMSW